MRGSAGSSPSARLLVGPRDAVVLENVAQRDGSADAQLGMVFAQVVRHRRRLGVADAVHEEQAHPAAKTRNLELGAAVEHESTLLAPRVRR